ncbi:MAG TPA: DUF2142 domain-containing protein [Acidimicrobiales bacterium]|nr:DUF2142 domain-containing protein [Acidimicrobiales bacterium]
MIGKEQLGPHLGADTAHLAIGPPAGANHVPAHAASRRGAVPMWRTWMVAFGALWLASVAWALASPIGSGPDEPAHLIRAASLVRGQLVGTPVPHASNALKSTVSVEAPQVFARLANDVGCFQFKPDVTAHCQGSLAGSPHDVAVYTYVGRYPPLYYGLVGLPTLVVVSPTGIYLARVVSAALSAAMLALAVTSLRRCQGAPLLGAGLALAVTPMALYLAAVINPSGLEISSAISAWTAAMALASRGPEGTDNAMLATLAISAVTLLLTRALSPLWVVFVAAGLLALRPSLLALLRSRQAQIWLAACAVAGVLAAIWDIYADPFLTEPGAAIPPGASELHILDLALQRLYLLVTSSIGYFGWLDTPSPHGVLATWLLALGVVGIAAVLVARLRAAIAVVAVLVAWVGVPVMLIVSQARSEGILGQGRDFMGLAVGFPIMAGLAAGERLQGRRATLIVTKAVIGVLVACQVADFYSALRRNTVGDRGPLDAFAAVPNGWAPPLPALVLFACFTMAIVAFGATLWLAARAQPRLTPAMPVAFLA